MEFRKRCAGFRFGTLRCWSASDRVLRLPKQSLCLRYQRLYSRSCTGSGAARNGAPGVFSPSVWWHLLASPTFLLTGRSELSSRPAVLLTRRPVVFPPRTFSVGHGTVAEASFE